MFSGRDFMAIFHITPATSVLKATGTAFLSDSPGADTLIVDPGAFLISESVGAGANLANTGAWTVTVNGSIVSQDFNGIFLTAGNAAVSTIKIGVDGSVQGNGFGIFLLSSANINNAGTVSGLSGIEILNGGTHTITNSGIINATGFSIADLSVSIDTVRNSGRIIGTMSLGGGDDTVTNFAIVGDVIKSGTIAGTVDLGAGNDNFTGGANSETVKDENGADTYRARRRQRYIHRDRQQRKRRDRPRQRWGRHRYFSCTPSGLRSDRSSRAMSTATRSPTSQSRSKIPRTPSRWPARTSSYRAASSAS
jgi:hypothetical protein